jgi:arsenate reductase
MAANVIFELDAVHWSTTERSGPALWLSEVLATFGLLMVIIGVVRSRKDHWVAISVGAYISGAYFFTSSTSFANPAVTVARTFSDTFAGIAPASAPMFVVCQLVGCLLAVGVMRITHPK